jgi:hypothetical protein
MEHSFNTRLACKLGVPAAILLKQFAFWVQKNEANNRNFIDGKYWTYNSQKAFTEMFPYLSRSIIRGALDTLIKEGYLLKGNFNRLGYDRTTWYTITDKAKAAVQYDDKEENPAKKSISEDSPSKIAQKVPELAIGENFTIEKTNLSNALVKSDNGLVGNANGVAKIANGKVGNANGVVKSANGMDKSDNGLVGLTNGLSRFNQPIPDINPVILSDHNPDNNHGGIAQSAWPAAPPDQSEIDGQIVHNAKKRQPYLTGDILRRLSRDASKDDFMRYLRYIGSRPDQIRTFKLFRDILREVVENPDLGSDQAGLRDWEREMQIIFEGEQL